MHAAQAPPVAMARAQSNHHHHHHHVSSSTTSSRSLFEISQIVPNGYLGYAGSGGGSSYAPPTIASHHVKSSSTAAATTQLLPPPAITPLRLTGREDATRARLQKQRIGEQHRGQIIVGNRIPGFKTSAAFFASLRTNLRLHASPPSSPMSTPPSMHGSMTSLPPPSPLSGPAELAESEPPALEDPMDGVPELQSYIARTEADKTDALRLVADSIAQMRQAANRALIFHPLNLALVVGVLSLFARWVYDVKHDWSLVGTSCAGVLMAWLAACRWFTQGYLRAAEEVDWEWTRGADVLVTKFGDEVIGAALVEWVSGESSRQKRKKAWRGEIRAWTVRLKYRGKGVGAALLEDAVKEARKKSAESLEFAEDHANSKRILPMIYNSKFDERERKSRELLQDLLEASPTRGKRR
ncbi:hypothetical protein Q7P37_008490 [Cladosporium fusiforme]